MRVLRVSTKHEVALGQAIDKQEHAASRRKHSNALMWFSASFAEIGLRLTVA